MVSRSHTLIYISIFSGLEASDKILKILDQVSEPVLSRSAITRRKKTQHGGTLRQALYCAQPGIKCILIYDIFNLGWGPSGHYPIIPEETSALTEPCYHDFGFFLLSTSQHSAQNSQKDLSGDASTASPLHAVLLLIRFFGVC